MKLSYIITPSDSMEYLIRCINSLYRQTSKDFEIILAENKFGEDEEAIEAYLQKHNEIKCISNIADSYIKKLEEAISLLADDTEYMTFLTVDTVVASITAEIVEEEAAGAELFVPSVVLKEKEKTYISRITEGSRWDAVKALSIYRIFYGKKAISEFKAEYFENGEAFEIYKFNQLLGSEIVSSDKVCFYIEKREIKAGNDTILTCYEQVVNLLDKVMKQEKKELRIKFYDYYLKKYFAVFNAKETEEDKREAAFADIKKLGELAQNDFAIRKIYELYLGCSVEEAQCLDLVSYQIFIGKVNELSCTKEVVTQVIPVENKNNSLFMEQLPEIDSILQVQEQLKADMQEVKKNLHYLMQTMSEGDKQGSLNYLNPVEEIPAMFAQGKLGFSVIIKSMKAWIAYKFGRK